jgi:hypothetical protein
LTATERSPSKPVERCGLFHAIAQVSTMIYPELIDALKLLTAKEAIIDLILAAIHLSSGDRTDANTVEN